MHFGQESRWTLIFMMLSSWPGFVFAGRPFVADDAGLVEQGGFEFETAADFGKNYAAYSLQLKNGLTNSADLGISLGQNQFPIEERGFTNADLGLKFAFVPDLVAASFSTTLGTGSYAVNTVVSKSFGIIRADGNLGLSLSDEDKGNADITYGMVLEYKSKLFCIGTEAGGKRKEGWIGGNSEQNFRSLSGSSSISALEESLKKLRRLRPQQEFC